jgi:hypothetical protein
LGCGKHGVFAKALVDFSVTWMEKNREYDAKEWFHESVFLSLTSPRLKLVADYVSGRMRAKGGDVLPTAANPEDVKFHVYTDMSSLRRSALRCNDPISAEGAKRRYCVKYARTFLVRGPAENVFVILLQEMKRKMSTRYY